MTPFLLIKMAFLSLKRHPIRSGLALLGIVIGIASMTMTMALGEGANERMKQEILAMGDGWIFIHPGNFLNNGEVKRVRKKGKKLQYGDYLAIRQFSSDIKACTPCIESKELVKYQGKQLVAEAQGVNADFFRIEPRGIQTGSSFTSHHDQMGMDVAILGSQVAKELFKHEDPIGKTIVIGTYPFQVMGVFNESEAKMNQTQNPNINVIVPFSSLWRKMKHLRNRNSLHAIIVKPKDDKNSAQVVSGLRRLLRFRHEISEAEPDDFTIWDLQAIMQAASQSSKTFNHFLLIAASVSLIVGGIGIMNVMLVAMTERRKEIGIKMAIGASSTHILFQFLMESIFLCLTGGVLGVFIGIGGAYFLGKFTDFEWVLREQPIILAFTTTISAGLFFGFYPAYKASKLNPIEALH